MTITNKAGSDKPLGIYVHVPFCVKKCLYCDFLSFENEDKSAHEAYAKGLIKEIEEKAAFIEKAGMKYTVDTVFIGGGTPSIMAPALVGDMIYAVKQTFNVDVNIEITIEANPGTLGEEKLKSYLSYGVNRLSIGAQSFDDRMLKTLGRIHSPLDIDRCFKAARASGFKNINLDLMFALPGQTLETWEDTLDRAVELCPEHISFYSLQIEEGTKIHDLLSSGVYEGMADELDREMYRLAVKKLPEAGYAHYEISNAAKPGFECRHNIKYWTMEEYLGFGEGAHGYIGGKRLFDGKTHENSASDDISEYMFTGLRMMRGINLSDFERRFKKPVREIYHKEWPAVERYIKDGFLIMESGNIRLSEKGIDISNRIMSEFILQ